MTLFTAPPLIEKNPNENVPLVALVKFSTTDPVTTKLTIEDGRKIRTVTYGPDYDPPGAPRNWHACGHETPNHR